MKQLSYHFCILSISPATCWRGGYWCTHSHTDAHTALLSILFILISRVKSRADKSRRQYGIPWSIFDLTSIRISSLLSLYPATRALHPNFKQLKGEVQTGPKTSQSQKFIRSVKFFPSRAAHSHCESSASLRFISLSHTFKWTRALCRSHSFPLFRGRKKKN